MGEGMKRPKCEPFPSAARYRRKAVRSLSYDGETLTLDIQGEGFAFARVVFRRTVGFRVLDERDLYEFWDTYSEPNGWLYEVEEGGWLELESQRPSFTSLEVCVGLREYLVVDEKCVSVLTAQPPEFVDLGADPEQQREV